MTIRKLSERRLIDTVRIEERRAAEKWAEVDRATAAGDLPAAEDARTAAGWHQRTVNLIRGAVPELPR